MQMTLTTLALGIQRRIDFRARGIRREPRIVCLCQSGNVEQINLFVVLAILKKQCLDKEPLVVSIICRHICAAPMLTKLASAFDIHTRQKLRLRLDMPLQIQKSHKTSRGSLRTLISTCPRSVVAPSDIPCKRQPCHTNIVHRQPLHHDRHAKTQILP